MSATATASTVPSTVPSNVPSKATPVTPGMTLAFLSLFLMGSLASSVSAQVAIPGVTVPDPGLAVASSSPSAPSTSTSMPDPATAAQQGFQSAPAGTPVTAQQLYYQQQQALAESAPASSPSQSTSLLSGQSPSDSSIPQNNPFLPTASDNLPAPPPGYENNNSYTSAGEIEPPQGLGPAGAPSSLPPLPPPTVEGQVDKVVENYFGMTPDQIRNLRNTIDARQRAASELPNPPKAVTGSVRLSLSPGSTPPIIRTFQGSVSSFVVVDSTGSPWPVENFLVGSKLFSVSRLDEAQGSTFAIETMGMYGQSNLVLKLKGIPTPAVVMLMAGQSELDGRVEVRVEGRGPNAQITSSSLPEGTDARLLSVLDGVPPEGGVRLKVSGLDQVSAWMLPDRTMVVRSPVRIIKPATTQFVSSSDGTYVYTFPPSPRLLGIANGTFVDLAVSGW